MHPRPLTRGGCHLPGETTPYPAPSRFQNHLRSAGHLQNSSMLRAVVRNLAGLCTASQFDMSLGTSAVTGRSHEQVRNVSHAPPCRQQAWLAWGAQLAQLRPDSHPARWPQAQKRDRNPRSQSIPLSCEANSRQTLNPGMQQGLGRKVRWGDCWDEREGAAREHTHLMQPNNH